MIQGILRRYKKPIRYGAVAGVVLGCLVISGLYLFTGQPQTAQASGERDCEATSVIWCGTLTVDELVTQYNAGGTAPHHYGDIAAIYNSFGISSADVMGLKAHAANGQVKADGTVWLNGKQISSGAMTAGRVKTAHSVAIAGTGAFRRPPSDSFASSTTVIDAFIGVDASGQPTGWAILKSCGNPVSFNVPKPAPPHIVLKKHVQDPQTRQFVKDATFTNGAVITYEVDVTNTGGSADTNVTVTDKLPANQTYVTGSTKKNAAATSDGIMAGGLSLGTVAPGQVFFITFQAKVQVPLTACGMASMVNTATVKSAHVPGQSDTATTHVTVNCATISAICSRLTASTDTIQAGKTVTFTAVGTANGTRIVSYDFSVDGQVKQSSGSNQFVFSASGEGTHTVSVIIRFANGTTAGGSGVCAAPVTVSPTPPPTPPTPMCTIPGKENLPANSPECVLVNTGAGTAGLVGLFVGTSAVAGFGYYQFMAYRRRTS